MVDELVVFGDTATDNPRTFAVRQLVVLFNPRVRVKSAKEALLVLEDFAQEARGKHHSVDYEDAVSCTIRCWGFLSSGEVGEAKKLLAKVGIEVTG